jgi:hypothetical protein
MLVKPMKAKIQRLAQSCPRLFNAPFHRRNYLNSANPETATPAPRNV